MSPRTRIKPARLLSVVLASALAVGFGGHATTAGAGPSQTPPRQRSEPPKVDELLERFPIGTATVADPAVAPASTPPASAPPAAITPPIEDSGDGVAWAPIAAAAGAVVLLGAMGAGVLLGLHRRTRTAAIWETTPSLTLLYETLAIANQECDKLEPAVPSTRRRPPVAEVSQGLSQSPPAESEQAGDVPSEIRDSDAADSLEHTGVVERISAILQAAEAAAAAIRTEAVAKAEEISRAAAAEGEVLLAQVREEAARIRNVAEGAAKEAHSAAESYGAKQRREAEQQVQQMLAQGEAQARATRQAAEEMARQIEEAAREREEKLKAQMQPLETSLRRALDAFRGITSQLEDLLDSEPAGEGETLVDALSGSVRRTGEWEETSPPQQRTNG